jgi:hypothetical protein
MALFRRFAGIPVVHFVFAIGVAAAVWLGCWLELRALPVEYTSSALLSYQVPHQFLAERSPGDPEIPVLRIAESALTPATLLYVADQSHFAFDSGLQPSSARAVSFRSHIDLEQPAPGLLQVTFRGGDEKQVGFAANALAGALAAWVPKPASAPVSAVAPKPAPLPHPAPVRTSVTPKPVTPQSSVGPAASPAQPPTAAAKKKAAELQRQAAALQENLATLLLQQQSIEARILARIAEEKKLERAASKSSPASRLEAAPPAAAREQLAGITRDLDSLRALRATVVTEEMTEKRQAQSYRAEAGALLSSAPASTPPPAVSAPADASAATPPPASTEVIVPVATTPAIAVDTPAAADPLNSSDDAQQPTWQGSFSVLTWGETPHPLGDDTRKFLRWGIAGLAALVFLAYLGLVAWRFRPVSTPASLRHVLPSGVKYFGSVAGSPIVPSSLAVSPFPEKSL